MTEEYSKKSEEMHLKTFPKRFIYSRIHIITMHTFTDKDIDSATQKHLTRMNSDYWYALALKIPETTKRKEIRCGLENILRTKQTGIKGDLIYFVGHLSDRKIIEIKDYLESQKGIASARILKSERYGPFVGNPKYWLRDYAFLS